jgi:SAM-dependent methyltransferase/tetratricopeptide (TPR) repeat protein
MDLGNHSMSICTRLDASKTSQAPAPEAAEFHRQGLQAMAAGDSERALDLFAKAAEAEPNNALYSLSIGRLLAQEGMLNQSTLAFLRAQELSPKEPGILLELAEVLKRLDKTQEAAAVLDAASRLSPSPPPAPPAAISVAVSASPAPPSPLVLHGSCFDKLALHGDATGCSLVGTSSNGQHFLKLELRHHPAKRQTLEGERDIMLALNRKHCVTCPTVIGFGSILRTDLERCLDESGKKVLAPFPAESYAYLVEQFVPSTSGATLGDLLLAVLEQKALGIFHADLRPENCRMDNATGVCYLIDYDQAEPLDEQTQQLDNLSFLDWCDTFVRAKYARWNFRHFLHYFPTIDRQTAVAKLFRNGAFNLASTRLFTNQITTAASAGIYHTIREKSVFIDGERSLDSRRGYLDSISFAKGERVLDVGCSSGIVSTYLARRDCKVTGIDIDPEIIRGCRVLSHILGDDISFLHHDLDKGPVPGEFDTVLLFSVIHHTRSLSDNARSLAQQTRRIIIECRLKEGGLKPAEDGRWVATSAWNYATVEAMVEGLEALFPGFRLRKNWGQGDRERYILELVKAA